MSDYDLTYLSWGAGTQSTAMLVMSALGLHGVPRATVAVFSDTGDEPASVYDTLRFYKGWAEGHGIEVVVVSAGHLSQDIAANATFAPIPAFTAAPDSQGSSMLRRQCTREYKIAPIEKEVRRLLGYRKGQQIRKSARSMIGITTDEIARMRPSRTPWVTNAHPLIDANLSRADCVAFIAERGLPAPSKSACVYCPFKRDDDWEEMQADDPQSFEQACAVDDIIRNKSMGGSDAPMFLHRSLKPLRDVSFKDWKRPGQLRLFDGMNQECEGMCGV